MTGYRSYLFVPAKNPSMMDKALLSNADSVIFDLEDAVAIEKKGEARKNVKEKLEIYNGEKPIYVRINDLTTNHWQADLTVSLLYGAKGVFVPKSENPKDLKRVSDLVHAHYNHLSQNNNDQYFEIIPIIESAQGVQFAYEIAKVDSLVSTLAFGSLDFSLDIGCELTASGEELLYARSRLVIASKAATKSSPIDAVFPDLSNSEGLLKETKRAKSLGFSGKLTIHPKQVDSVHEGFKPNEKDIQEAIAIVKQFLEAERKGIASISVNNKLVDYPVYKRAKALLDHYSISS